jgi:Fe2+ transport system protein FeoA
MRLLRRLQPRYVPQVRLRAAADSKVVGANLEEVFEQKEDRNELTLAQLQKGQSRAIKEIVHDEEGHWRKLTAFGIMPGSMVSMLQRWPTFVVRVGRTEVGLDEVTSSLVILED